MLNHHHRFDPVKLRVPRRPWYEHPAFTIAIAVMTATVVGCAVYGAIKLIASL